MHTIQNECLSVMSRYWISPKFLMTVLVWKCLKQASLGQCILQAMKSNSVIPRLLLGLNVEIDHATESYWQKFQSWYMLSPMIILIDINSQDRWRLPARLPQKWVHTVCSRQR